MIVFPAIDLIAGKVVRLRRGERSQMDVYSDDPVAVAEDFARRGATWIHVVDLSATFEEDDDALARNRVAIEGICNVPGISVDTGGGVRNLSDVVWYTINQSTDGIGAPVSDDVVSEYCTDLMGRRVSSSYKGIVIVTRVMADGSHHSTKMVRR